MNTRVYEEFSRRMKANMGKIILGKERQIELLLVCLLCKGHLLLEDVPGTGKTVLLRALAISLGGSFSRIQLTPDVMPSDITGINYYNQKEGDFVFRPGPLFAHTVLADEINRATPRTQSALLEAMAEGQVSVDAVSYPLPEGFTVVATQNAVESYGTFPLPEAQLDRFMMCLSMGYMEREQELQVARRKDSFTLLEGLEAVSSIEELVSLQAGLEEVTLSSELENYIMDIVELTREHQQIKLGASPRATLALYRGSRAYAALQGRGYVTPEDVQVIAMGVLPHRLLLRTAANTAQQRALVEELLQQVETPFEHR